MRLFSLLITACAEAHSFVPTAVEAGPSLAACEAPFLEDGEYCVAWFPAAPLPIEDEGELIQLAYSADFLVRQGEAIHRYDAERDRWMPDEGTAIPYEIDREHVPPQSGSEVQVLGFLWNGIRVLLRRSVHAAEWGAERDLSDGAWRPTVAPDPFLIRDPIVAFPIAADTILFASPWRSGRFVSRPR